MKEQVEYLKALSKLAESGYHVDSEVREVINEIRTQLGFIPEQLRHKHLQSFTTLLGSKPTLLQVNLFEAAFGGHKGSHVLHDASDVKAAVKVLNNMQNNVELLIIDESLTLISRRNGK